MPITRLAQILLLAVAAVLVSGCGTDGGNDSAPTAPLDGTETTLKLGVPQAGSHLGIGSDRYLFHTEGLDTYLVSFPILSGQTSILDGLELALPPVQNGALVLSACSFDGECTLYDSDLVVGLRPDKDYVFELQLQTDDNIEYLVAVEEGEGTSEGSRAEPVPLKLDTTHLGKVAEDGRSFYRFTASSAGNFVVDEEGIFNSDVEFYSDPDFTVPVAGCGFTCDFSLLASETVYIRVVGTTRYRPYRLTVSLE